MLHNRFTIGKTLFFVLISMLVMSSCSQKQKKEQPYKPALPATTPAEELIVLDLINDIFPEDGSSGRRTVYDDALNTLTAIQGLVNRNSSSKIYFLNMPTYYPDSWNKDSKFHAENGWMLDLGIYDVPVKRPEVDESKRFPVLSYLLEQYSSHIKGKVLYPEIAGADLEHADKQRAIAENTGRSYVHHIAYAPESAAIAAALTACGMEDAIPVSHQINAYLQEEGHDFDLLADTRDLKSNEEAFDWAFENYFTRETNRHFVGGFMYEHIYAPSFHDYYIANKAFVTVLNPRLESQYSRMEKLLEHYPDGAPILGCVVQNEQDYPELGTSITITEIGNTSATSSFTHNPSGLTEPPAPKPLPVKDNGVYVAFYVGDGDVPGLTQNQNIEIFMKHRETLNQIYYDIQVCPYYMDLNPPLMKYWMENQSRHITLSTSLNDGDAPTQEGGRMWYKKIHKYYYDHARGNLMVYNHFRDPSFDCAQYFEPYVKILGWGNLKETPSPVERIPNTNSIQIQIVDAYHSRAFEQKEAAINAGIENSDGGEPIFMLLKVGGGWGNSIVENLHEIKELMEQYKASPPSGREVFFCTPVDLAATWKKWKGIPVDLPQRDKNPEYPYPQNSQ